MTDLPLVALHGFGLAFVWSVLTCAGCVVAVLTVDSVSLASDFAERIDAAMQRLFILGLCGHIVSLAGVVTCGAWLLMSKMFGG